MEKTEDYLSMGSCDSRIKSSPDWLEKKLMKLDFGKLLLLAAFATLALGAAIMYFLCPMAPH